MKCAVDNPTVAKIAEKVFRPFSDDNEVRYWFSDRCRQFSHSTEWFLSFAKHLKVPTATSKDLQEWRLGSKTAPLHVLRTRPQEVKNKVASGAGAVVYIFSFPQQLKHLSGCYEYHSQHKDSPCFRRRKLPQLFLLKSSAGLRVIRDGSCQDLCTSSNLIHFERPDKSIERASCTVAEEWPQPPEPSSSSTPVPAQAQKKRRVTIGYDMEKVRQYVRDEHADGLVTREDEDCDMKVIYEVFGRACYKPSDNTAAALFSPKSLDSVLDLGGHIGTATRWFLEQGISESPVPTCRQQPACADFCVNADSQQRQRLLKKNPPTLPLPAGSIFRRLPRLEDRILEIALLYVFTFPQQLKHLSGCCEYFNQHRDSPCFKRWKLTQLLLLTSGAGLRVIRGASREDLCTSNTRIHFGCPGKSLEKVSCTVAEELPESSSFSTPAQAEAAAPKKCRVTIGYEMEQVRK